MEVDESFALKASELTAADWAMTFGIDLFSPMGILLERVVKSLSETDVKSPMEDILKRAELGLDIKEDVENLKIKQKDSGYEKQDYSFDDVVDAVKTSGADPNIRDGLENRLLAAEDWGLFHEKGTPISITSQPPATIALRRDGNLPISGSPAVR